MLDFGNFKSRDCGNGIGRRSFIKTASALPFAFGAGYGGMDLEATAKLQDRLSAMPPEKTPRTTFLSFCTRIEEL